MTVIGVIDDELSHLLKVCANFLVQTIGDIQVKPYLVAEELDPRCVEEITSRQDEIRRYHPNVQFPPIQCFPVSAFGEMGPYRTILAQFAADNVDVVVCDCKIQEDEVAGLRLLNKLLAEKCFVEQATEYYLMTMHFSSLSKWTYEKQSGQSDGRIRYLDKASCLTAFPDQTDTAITELVERAISVKQATNNVRGKKAFGGFVGGSKTLNDGPQSPYAVAELANLATRRGVDRGTVLLIGEQGTGKDVFATAIRDHSDRSGADRPFIPLDCGNLNEALMGSELFGHKKGAFTGATEARKGMVREADTGTLFLDEIHNLKLDAQKRLLRVLEKREVLPVGQDKAVKVDVRLIVATNRNLDDLVASGEFLSDLLTRLAVWKIHLPPLRDRKEDIPLLVKHFLDETSKDQPSNNIKNSFTIERGALELLANSDWPENVRGLRNCLIRASTYAEQSAGTRKPIVISREHIRLALPAATDKPLITKEMSAEQIVTGIHNNKLQRISLVELKDLVGDKTTYEVLKACKRYTKNDPETTTVLFPGTTYDAIRQHESRLKKRLAKESQELLSGPQSESADHDSSSLTNE